MCGAAGASISSSSRTASSHSARAGDGRAAVAEQRVRQLHELGDHRVEVERLVVGGDVAQRPVRGRRGSPPAVGLVCAGRQRARVGIARLAAVRVEGERPDPVQEAMDAADPGRAPRPALVPRAHEHQEQPDRVGAVARDELVGILDVAARLRHPLAVGAQDLALVEQPLERLVLLDQPDVAHHLRELAGVEQVHDRVLGAAGVLVDRRPPLDQVAVDRAVRASPATGSGYQYQDESMNVSIVSVSRRAGPPQIGQVDVEERLVAGQRVLAAAAVVDGVGQPDGQVLVGHRHDAVASGSR